MNRKHDYMVKVGFGTCGISAGANKVYDAFEKILNSNGTSFDLVKSGCRGMCYSEVNVEVQDKQGNFYVYGYITPELAQDIIEQHVKNGNPLKDYLLYDNKDKYDDSPYLDYQQRIVLRNCGKIDPLSIEEYLENDGYKAIEKVLKKMSPEDVIEEVLSSGLRGRGGAGFPTGMKWKGTYSSKSDKKYVVCNGDEGDPGAFMDRSILEGDPHSVLEGMMIAGYSVGADEGYIYVRAEYPLAIHNLKKAISDATERGYLGNNIFGTDFSFNLKIKEGAGAFVCGEETALLASIEGQRGMPRFRPPFPSDKGLWGYPTNINNVETYGNVPWIINNGAKAYHEHGKNKSRGTKVFALAGKIKRGGLVEVPMGMSIRDVVYKVGGGILDDKPFKAVQLGGPSGGCLPEALIDTSIEYETLMKTGAIMGSGGMVIMDSTSCMVDIAKFFLTFTQKESCGKCTFCRTGTKRMLEILEKITEGKAEMSDLDLLEDLAEKIHISSLCGLGQSAPNPVLTTLKYFREEYEAHILEKKCPAKYCKPLMHLHIDAELCTACGLCIKRCPADAIIGEKKQVPTLDNDLCIKCGKCLTACKFDAIIWD